VATCPRFVSSSAGDVLLIAVIVATRPFRMSIPIRANISGKEAL